MTPMSHPDDGEHGRFGDWGLAVGEKGAAFDSERAGTRSLSRIADTCSDLVSGVFLTSSEMDADGELVDPRILGRIGVEWTARLTDELDSYRIRRDRDERSGTRAVEASSEHRGEMPAGREGE